MEKGATHYAHVFYPLTGLNSRFDIALEQYILNIGVEARSTIEILIADDLWPLPTYQEMLFML